ncbi:MAG: hypothetical protein WDM85_09535 [Caulobacteraceae bacterium]
MAEGELSQQLRGRRLTTAEVIYYMPDHPALLQRFMWQTLDLPPEFPAHLPLPRFLAARDRCGDPLGDLLRRRPGLPGQARSRPRDRHAALAGPTTAQLRCNVALMF